MPLGKGQQKQQEHFRCQGDLVAPVAMA
jgi:hypothetical protein